MTGRTLTKVLYFAGVCLAAWAGVSLYLHSPPAEANAALFEPPKIQASAGTGEMDYARLELARLSNRPAVQKRAAPRAVRSRRKPLAERIRIVSIYDDGAIIEEKRSKKQRMVAAGEQAFDLKVIAIEENAVTFEEDGKRIKLEGRK